MKLGIRSTIQTLNSYSFRLGKPNESPVSLGFTCDIMTQEEINVMWDAPLYAVNIFYYHWLIKKLLWSVARQNIVRWEIQI